MEYGNIVEKFISEYGFLSNIPKRDMDKYPPWAIRKYIEMSGSLLHPELSEELRILSYCTSESVYLNRKILQSYFAWSYSLTSETSYSLVMYFAGEDFSILSPFSQIDGITYNAVDTNGPESNAEVFDIDAISESFRSDVQSEDKYVNLRIGSSAHKSDLIWFVKKYWKDIEPLFEHPDIDSRQIRPRPEAVRNIKEYAMRRQKVPMKIRKLAHSEFIEHQPYYVNLNGGYKQVKPNAKKNNYDLFSIVREQLSQSLTHHLGINTYSLCLDDSGDAPYFYLEHR